MLSSSSSFGSYDSLDVRNLIHERSEVGQLELCLNTVQTTLFAFEEETNVA
jgi:hypothetical protein